MSAWTLTEWPSSNPLAPLSVPSTGHNRWARHPCVPVARQGEDLEPNLPEAGRVTEQPQSRPDALHDRELKAWSARLAQAVLEVLEGGRSTSQLARWVSPPVYASLDQRVRQIRRHSGNQPAALVRRRASPSVMSTHVCQPAAGIAEVAVHVRTGSRSRAIALRLERDADRWLCTSFTIL